MLFIAEAPPAAVDRFFYYECVEKHDWLFLGIQKVFEPEKADIYLNSLRPPFTKKRDVGKLQEERAIFAGFVSDGRNY